MSAKAKIFEYEDLKELVASIAAGNVNITCESCRYNLRGIAGEEKTCPECGNKNQFTSFVSNVDIHCVREDFRRMSTRTAAFPISLFCGILFACPAVLFLVLIGFADMFIIIPLLLILSAIPMYGLFASISSYSELTMFFRGMPDRYLMVFRLPGGRRSVIFLNLSFVLGIVLLSVLGVLKDPSSFLSASLLLFVFSVSTVFFLIVLPILRISPDVFTNRIVEAGLRVFCRKRINSYQARIHEDI